jgi:hypothetical protein
MTGEVVEKVLAVGSRHVDSRTEAVAFVGVRKSCGDVPLILKERSALMSADVLAGAMIPELPQLNGGLAQTVSWAVC